MTVTACVFYRCKPGREKELEAALRELMRETNQEAGCMTYRAHRDPDDPQRYFLYEHYADEAALKTHQSSDYFEKWVKGVIPTLLDERRIERFEALP